MTGLPTLQVLLDDGTGTYPTDISTLVMLNRGVTKSGYGRADEFAQSQPATLALTLENTDGTFSTLGAGFGSGPFGLGPFGGHIPLVPTQKIRVKVTKGATTRDWFTGSINTLDLGWPGGGQTQAEVTVTAADFLADLARRPMRSMLEEEILLDSPTAYYTLGEAEGSTSAGDTSGNAAAPLTITGTGAALAFGNGTGPVDGLSAVTFAGGQYLDGVSADWIGTGDWTIECVVAIASAPAVAVSVLELLSGDDRLGLNVLSSGRPQGVNGASVNNTSTVVTDGSLHHLAVTSDGALLKLYVDGVFGGTPSVSTPLAGPITQLRIGAGTAFTTPMSGAVASVSLTPSALSADRIADHAAIALSTLTETTDARITRLAGYAGLTATTDSPSGQVMGAQSTTGSSLFDAMQTVATAEGGFLYANGSGDLHMQGRYYRGLRTTADLTLGETDPGEDTKVTWDTQQQINQVTVTRTGGAAQTYPVLSPGTPVSAQSLELAVDTDENALAAAQWVVSKHQDTSPRIGGVDLDLLTSTNGEAIHARSLGDRLTFSVMPSQLWVGAGDYTLEGWSETISHEAWSRSVNLLPWSLSEVFILDNSTYGVLDGDAPIGY